MSIFDWLCKKYTQTQDKRQSEMGLQYMTAETHDLAKEISARFEATIADRLSVERTQRDRYAELLNELIIASGISPEDETDYPLSGPDLCAAAAETVTHLKAQVEWRDLATAPKDGTLVMLLVEFNYNPVDDVVPGTPQVTIGHNSFNHTEIDEWDIVGWCWQQDHYTAGSARVIGWRPFNREVPTDGA